MENHQIAGFLSRKQFLSLESQNKRDIPHAIINSNISSSFQLPDENNYYEEDEIQGFAEFLDMRKRKPNLKGTGRNKITKLKNYY